MDLEQIQKRIQWVEDDRRKEKDSIAMLENRLVSFEGGLAAVNEQVKEFNSEITRLSAVLTRMDQFDRSILQMRIETKQMVDDLDKDIKQRNEEVEKIRLVEKKSLESNISEVREELEPIPRIEKNVQARVEEEDRLRRVIEELDKKVTEFRREEEEYTRTFRLIEDGRRQDSKRLVDLQAETTATRKRVDDLRGQSEIHSANLRKSETRLNELANVEAERQDMISSFLDKQALTQAERDRAWKEWETRFETIEKQAADIEAQLLTLDATHRDTRRARAALEDLSERVERRINEITEIQRLAEDRFRQEWATFKADDQKRWTNYTLTQEEQRNEILRQFEKLTEQTTILEDELQEVKDLLQQTNELAEKRLQSILANAHEWVSAFEKTIGRSR
jgi:DNA repair exonuclease SbcCD ATPase subunit